MLSATWKRAVFLIALLMMVMATSLGWSAPARSDNGSCDMTQQGGRLAKSLILGCQSPGSGGGEEVSGGQRPHESGTTPGNGATTSPRVSEPRPLDSVTYCDNNTIHTTYLDTGLTATAGIGCTTTPDHTPTTSPAPTPHRVITITPEQAARVAATRLDLTAPTPHIGPDWTRNEWNMLAVGFPAWAWTDTTTLTPPASRETVSGITVTLTAARPHLSINFGDGTTINCDSGGTKITLSRWRNARNHESPTCGHTWHTPGTYPVTVTATWQVAWSGLEHTGTITVSHTSPPVKVPVGELAATLINP